MNNNDIKRKFNETLARIMEYASMSGNTVSKKTIHIYFKDLITDDKMYDFIYKYLSDAKITVEGYEPETGNPPSRKEVKESNEALAFYEMYLDEMHAAAVHSTHELPKLFSSLISGNPAVAGALSELYLPLVIKLSENFDNMGLSHSDLVAEGNLALYEGTLEYASRPDVSSDIKDFEQFISSRISGSMRNALNAEIGSCRISSHLTDRINALNDASTELAKELGREATLEELCERLSQGEDEVKELMKISINALTVVQTDED